MTRCWTISLFSLLGLDLSQVELELLALQDVAVSTSALAGTRCDGGEDTTCHELVLQGLLNLRLLLPLLVLLLALSGSLLVEDLLFGLVQLGSLLSTKGQGVMSLIPGK